MCTMPEALAWFDNATCRDRMLLAADPAVPDPGPRRWPSHHQYGFLPAMLPGGS